MPRLRDKATGSVVSVDDALAERLGDGYEPVRQKPKPAPKRPKADDK